MKKVMILQWNTVNGSVAITETMKELGFEFTMIDVNNTFRDKEHKAFFVDLFKKNKYDFAFSINYFDYLSEACHEFGIPYIAWTYDSPAKLGDIKCLEYDTTHLFSFDSYEVKRLKDRMGLKNVRYLPLAADVKRFNSIYCSAKDRKKYGADISFVGRLYDTEIQKYFDLLSDYRKGFINGVIDRCVGKYDANIVEMFHVEKLFEWKDENRFYDAIYNDDDEFSGTYIYERDFEKIHAKIARLVSDGISNRERLMLIAMLSNHWKFKLYSPSSHEIFKSTKECGVVEYFSEMPKVFKCSKVNMHVTYKGIKSGIPLRCLDIIGSHGFLLANYQKDFDEDFKDGENVVLYHSLDEAYEKCKYYIEHDEKREEVIRKGYEIVSTKYSYNSLIKRAIEESGLGHLLR